MAKVVVAMSGGVDSSVSASILLEEGYDIIGLTLNMGRCCDRRSIEDASLVSKQIGIKHHVLDISDTFNKNIINYFLDSYKIGQTPNPCARCNKLIKFKSIIGYMHDIGADYMATGHYARIIKNKDGLYNLCKAANLNKDQSYFLSTLDYNYLKFIKFPLGDFESKTKVREIAKKKNLIVANKSESQDVCFIGGKCSEYLSRNIGIAESGYIKHIDGEILGEHNGIFKYTIGQRKGLGISYSEPLFVVKLDEITNTVYVGSNDDLYSDTVYLRDFNELAEMKLDKEYIIKLRSTHRGQAGFVESFDKDNVVLKLKNPARAITKGQLCCLYDKDVVVGSGWIC